VEKVLLGVISIVALCGYSDANNLLLGRVQQPSRDMQWSSPLVTAPSSLPRDRHGTTSALDAVHRMPMALQKDGEVTRKRTSDGKLGPTWSARRSRQSGDWERHRQGGSDVPAINAYVVLMDVASALSRKQYAPGFCSNSSTCSASRARCSQVGAAAALALSVCFYARPFLCSPPARAEKSYPSNHLPATIL